MNHSVIRFTMGRVLFIFGFLLMAPLLVALLYREPLRFVASWTVAIGLCMVLAMVCLYRPPRKVKCTMQERAWESAPCSGSPFPPSVRFRFI